MTTAKPKAPTATTWMLEGEPPAPAEYKDAKPLTKAQRERLEPSATHTGTDPHGRAIGPAEDHKVAKRDAAGRTVPEAAALRASAAKRTTRTARKS